MLSYFSVFEATHWIALLNFGVSLVYLLCKVFNLLLNISMLRHIAPQFGT